MYRLFPLQLLLHRPGVREGGRVEGASGSKDMLVSE